MKQSNDSANRIENAIDILATLLEASIAIESASAAVELMRTEPSHEHQLGALQLIHEAEDVIATARNRLFSAEIAPSADLT